MPHSEVESASSNRKQCEHEWRKLGRRKRKWPCQSIEAQRVRTTPSKTGSCGSADVERPEE
jgi:hypothetical protein